MTPEPSAITTRRATGDDLDAVVRLRLALLREYPDHPIYGGLRPDAERLARPVFTSQLESGNETTFLAERDGLAIGILRTVEAAAAPFLAPSRYCYVSSVYVMPECRRSGVLRLLLERAQAWCRERGLREMRLHSVGAAIPAAAAWDALGFEVVEQVRMRRVDGASELLASSSSSRSLSSSSSSSSSRSSSSSSSRL